MTRLHVLHRLHGRPGACLALAASTVLLAACGSDDEPKPVLEIKTLSNRADLVSDGDVLVQLILPAGATTAGLKADINGSDITSAFATRADGRITGLVSGMKVGANVLTVSGDDVSTTALTITNHDRGGPVYSGSQPTPFVCATPTPQGATASLPATNASGLTTTASDGKCNIATEYKLYYKTTAAGCSFALPDPSPAVAFTATTPPTTATPPANPCFKPYTVGGSTPADLATTTTDAGQTLPYIVRVERGTMNRGIYDIAVLFDPAKPWSAVAPQAQWNGKVQYNFGASTGQPRRQARPATAWTDDRALSRGYMVVNNSMTDSLQNSNRVMMSETVMMMKEHISDQYGAIRFTVGNGCSGGSINSNMNASINPGLLDGITVSCTFPDSETVTMEVADCVALVEAYQKPQWLALMTGQTPAQVNARKAAINGHMDQSACHGWYNFFGSNSKAGVYFQRTVPAANNDSGVIVQSPTATNNCQLPAALVYDPVTNPGGARCNAWSWAESIWGKATGSPAARDTRDNTGVQYGLKALQSGAISGEEFVTLNEIVGGADRDTNPTAARSVADAEALNIAYRAGIVMSGANLAKTAVIDMRGYDDSLINVPPGFAGIPAASLQGVALFGIHQQWRSFSIRDRLDRDGGGHGNQAIWRFGRSGFSPSATMATEAFTTMDSWLTALKADSSSASLEQKIRNTRPAAAGDYCLLSSDAAQSTKVTNAASCDADPYLAPRSSPRQVAGGPRSEDILKCQLKPVDANDYGGKLGAAQLARLNAVFPGGVCDWSKPGVGQQAAAGPLSFEAGPGGQPFPPAPVSRAKQ
ncbi:DUF6351 family protein [Roseateles violae]|uniref:DUF6351 family protein n=1 Tax=Roseateles violae TaxID=3058042 RepID=A0ABT8DY83_9BURK|nr:DUF6351 family protein [Pelomonas sp. PFR6]MDN3922229.1 DUF6351 family protein [Pelomonas sp. PFR6]